MQSADYAGQIERMPLGELRRACREAGVSPAGSRVMLIDRLVDLSQGRTEPVQQPSPDRGLQGSSRSGGGVSSMGGILGSGSHDFVDNSQASYSPSGGTPTRSRGNSATSGRASGGGGGAGYGQAQQAQYAAQPGFGQQQQQQQAYQQSYQPQHQPQGLSPFATDDDARLAAYTTRMSPGHGYGQQPPQAQDGHHHHHQQQHQSPFSQEPPPPQQQQQSLPFNQQQQQFEPQFAQPAAQQYTSPIGGGYVPSPGTARRAQFNGPPPSRVAHPDGSNCGNYISDRPSSKVLAPPGGASSFSFG